MFNQKRFCAAAAAVYFQSNKIFRGACEFESPPEKIVYNDTDLHLVGVGLARKRPEKFIVSLYLQPTTIRDLKYDLMTKPKWKEKLKHEPQERPFWLRFLTRAMKPILEPFLKHIIMHIDRWKEKRLTAKASYLVTNYLWMYIYLCPKYSESIKRNKNSEDNFEGVRACITMKVLQSTTRELICEDLDKAINSDDYEKLNSFRCNEFKDIFKIVVEEGLNEGDTLTFCW